MRIFNQITVIISILNEENNIGGCIKSIKKCGINKIIVIDGGSIDKSISIVKKNKIKCYVKKNKGLGFQRSVGIKYSKTKYIAIIDADHRPTKKVFLRLLKDLKKFNYSGIQPNLVQKKNLNYFQKSYQALNDINVNKSGPRDVIGTPSLWKAKIIKSNNYNKKITAGSDDTELCIRLKEKGFVFGGSSIKVQTLYRHKFSQYLKKFLWYGKGDAQLIRINPNMFLGLIKHQLINYPIKYSLISLRKFEIFPIPFFIFAGYIRFIGMMLEFIRDFLKIKEKIYST
tara:strand:+ start:2469 stop:3323 length:855 start_codon:yes stop_codon:yes gene_type:complete